MIQSVWLSFYFDGPWSQFTQCQLRSWRKTKMSRKHKRHDIWTNQLQTEKLIAQAASLSTLQNFGQRPWPLTGRSFFHLLLDFTSQEGSKLEAGQEYKVLWGVCIPVRSQHFDLENVVGQGQNPVASRHAWRHARGCSWGVTDCRTSLSFEAWNVLLLVSMKDSSWTFSQASLDNPLQQIAYLVNHSRSTNKTFRVDSCQIEQSHASKMVSPDEQLVRCMSKVVTLKSA